MRTQYLNNACFLAIVCIAFSTFFSCKKLVEIPPPDSSISSENVFQQDATAIGVLTDFYAELSTKAGDLGDFYTFFIRTGLSSDELKVYGNSVAYGLDYYKNSLTGNNSDQSDVEWRLAYEKIYRINAAIEGLSASTTLTPTVKQQLLGEAVFLRAYVYFHLVNLYGGVPLALTTDYKVNARLPRSTTEDVYKQITADLLAAQSLMSERYVSSDIFSTTPERVRPNKWVATALLARVYLYMKEYSNAQAQSTLLIENPSYQVTGVDLDKVFLKDSPETIWCLQGVNTGSSSNSGEGRIFVLTDKEPINWQTYLNEDQVAAFETGDQRRDKWINSTVYEGKTYYFPYKYKIGQREAGVAEYSVVFRLAEQYLIRAEARAQLGNIGGSQDDLNVIRNRAGLGGTLANDQGSLLDAILKERRAEFFTEGGHRWFDLKRTGKIDAVMTDAVKRKGGTWAPYKAFYPIPLREIRFNPSLNGQQNPGY